MSFLHELEGRPEMPVWLHLFADTRFRLFVNGQFVAYGPGRFVTQCPEYDSYLLDSYLVAGHNTIRVEVNYYGCFSFQSMPDGKPGFIAAGSGPGYNFSTPGEWRAVVHRAWDPMASHFSFAQNPVEICDTRKLASELSGQVFQNPVICEKVPWLNLRPRSVPYPRYEVLSPTRLVAAGPLRQEWRLLGFQSFNHDHLPGPKRGRLFRNFGTWIFSPRKQETELQCFWSDLELDGQPLKTKINPALGNCSCGKPQLSEGWNFLSGRFEIASFNWSYLLGIRKNSGCTFHAWPDRSENRMVSLGPTEQEPTPLLPFAGANAFVLPEAWAPDSGDPARVTPARLMGWDSFAEDAIVQDLPISRLPQAGAFAGEAVSWTLDFGDEYYGHPALEVEAPPGTILDVAYDDWLSERATANLYRSNPFVDSADRFVLSGGRQRIEACNPRGGIYMQVTMRNPQGGHFRLHSASVRSRRTLEIGQAKFRCDDGLFERSHRRALHTLIASTDESYSDCPWRERGDYLGDGYVALHVNRLISDNLPIPRRSLRLHADAQRKNGLLLSVAPSWQQQCHEDFVLIWILYLRAYWSMTGDLETVEEVWGTLEDIWASPRWQSHPSGLWNTTDAMHLFIDWGVDLNDRKGPANATLNAFRYAALEASAELALELGRFDRGEFFGKSARALKSSFERTLWMSSEGRFAANLGPDGHGSSALHANILALRFGLGDSAQLLQYLEPLLAANFRNGIRGGQFSGYAELYFFHYLLPALAEAGRTDLAENLIREHYGFLDRFGRTTLNECFLRANDGKGSCCHTWSGGVAHYLVTYAAGLRQAKPGDPTRWVVDPLPSSLRAVECHLPVRGGLIKVRVDRTGKTPSIKIEAPGTVTVTHKLPPARAAETALPLVAELPA